MRRTLDAVLPLSTHLDGIVWTVHMRFKYLVAIYFWMDIDIRLSQTNAISALYHFHVLMYTVSQKKGT